MIIEGYFLLILHKKVCFLVLIRNAIMRGAPSEYLQLMLL